MESTPECPIGSVSYFRVSSQEKNLHSGDLQADRQASTVTSSDVVSPCSPVSLISADSEPSSLSFNISDVSDICIRQLFDQHVVSPIMIVIMITLRCMGGLHQPLENFVLIFQRFGHLTSEEDSAPKLTKSQR